jgi:hypothetical protein
VIARLTTYQTDELKPLLLEVEAQARASSPAQRSNRRAELVFINTSSGEALSLLIGDDQSVTPVIRPSHPSTGEPHEYDVQLLQVGRRAEAE